MKLTIEIAEVDLDRAIVEGKGVGALLRMLDRARDKWIQEGRPSYVDIVFDGPPGLESGRFVEVEDSSGASIRFGEWVHREDGYWVLRIKR